MKVFPLAETNFVVLVPLSLIVTVYTEPSGLSVFMNLPSGLLVVTVLSSSGVILIYTVVPFV